jgi:Glycosyl hydrolases family 43
MSRDRLTCFTPYEVWPDDRGGHINAHGGGILFHDDRYYWFGEHKTGEEVGDAADVGVHVYSSTDLYNWKDEGIALAVSDDPESDIVKGCILERPKVIFNATAKQFVMWFHLELKEQGRHAARCGVATADNATGPYTFIESFRPGGAQSRDQTLFVDDDGKAYHLSSSEHNKTLHIAMLENGYLKSSEQYARVFEDRFMEAPAICRRQGKYYFLASGCSGWAPNTARSAVADSIMGPWQELENPCIGTNPHNNLGPDKTFGGQSTFVLPVQGKKDAFIAMFDVWRPENSIDARHVWLPMRFTGDGFLIKWMDEWDLSVFQDD